jgi:CheY-like chemotaxis protein
MTEGVNGGVRLLGTTDPLRLVALARQEKPELVALDVKAPGDGAWRALSGLRPETVGGALRTVLLLPEEADGQLGMDVGCFWALPKPISIENTLQSVKQVCGDLSGCTVVIGDPDADLRRILGEALAAAGCTVRGAEDGEEALEAMQRGPTAVAILNLVMPRVDALTALAQMRLNPQLRDVPVLVIVPAELDASEVRRLRDSADRVRELAPGPIRRLLDVVSARADMHRAGKSVLNFEF